MPSNTMSGAPTRLRAPSPKTPGPQGARTVETCTMIPAITVAAVEDDERMRQALVFQIAAAGLEVEPYASAEEFLQAAKPRRRQTPRSRRKQMIETNSPILMVPRHTPRLGAYALVAAIFLVPQLLWAQGTGQFEQPPIVNASQLLPQSALSGPGFHVERQVPTNGAMGQYTIVADASVFQGDAGTYRVESLNLLKIRLTEIPAVAYLENVSKTGVFANALAQSAERPVADAENMVVHPMDTVTGLPSGIGSFFGRVSLGVGHVASTASNSFGSGAAAGQTANATMTALGYDQVRRDLARKLHVDPYSSDPILAKKLNSVAWVMFSARLTVDAAMMAVPASIIISGVEFTNDLVYEKPKGDLILFVQHKLENMGLSQGEIAIFISNSAVPLSLQVSVVEDLKGLGDIPGRRAAAVALSNVMTEYQARFLATSLHMLDQWGQQKSPITRIQVPGVLVAHDQNGTVIVPAPIDYASWTPRIAAFVTTLALLALQNRVLWIPAKMTPLARQQLVANGWSVHESAQP